MDIDNNGEYADVPASIVEGITQASLDEFAQDELELIYPNETVEFEAESYTLKKASDGYYIEIYGEKTAGRERGYTNTTIEYVRYALED